MKWMAMCAMLFILAGCGGAPEKFTWNDMMSGGLQSLGYNSATVSGAQPARRPLLTAATT